MCSSVIIERAVFVSVYTRIKRNFMAKGFVVSPIRIDRKENRPLTSLFSQPKIAVSSSAFESVDKGC